MHSLRKNHRFLIHRTLVVHEPFGMHKCIPYELLIDKRTIKLQADNLKSTKKRK